MSSNYTIFPILECWLRPLLIFLLGKMLQTPDNTHSWIEVFERKVGLLLQKSADLKGFITTMLRLWNTDCLFNSYIFVMLRFMVLVSDRWEGHVLNYRRLSICRLTMSYPRCLPWKFDFIIYYQILSKRV